MTTLSAIKKPRQKYSDAQIVKAVEKAGGMIALAARALGCSRHTIHNRMNTSEAVKEAVEDAREVVLDNAELALAKAVKDGQAWAVIWTLKTLGKSRGYIEPSREQYKEQQSELSAKALESLQKFVRSIKE